MRYTNFKNAKGSSISISISKQGEIETNLFGKNEVVTNSAVAAELKGLFETINPCLKAIDPNNRILKNEDDIEIFEKEFNSLIENCFQAGFISSAFKVQTLSNNLIKPAVKRTTTATTTINNENTATTTINNDDKKESESNLNDSQVEATNSATNEQSNAISKATLKARCTAINELVKVFKDVCFNAIKSNRFINTLSKQSDLNSACDYVYSYALLENNPEADGVKCLTQSPEFERAFEKMQKLKTSNIINKRLDIYYGDAGTGKTTQAIKENPNASVVLCNNSMTPAELFEEFTFENGAPVYKDSAFMKAIKEGKTIILDEINLCNDEVLRALQTLVDGKQFFNYKNQKIEIKEGFKVIGTMNLIVNGCTYALPEPLVDRAGVLKEFSINVENLALRAF